MKSRNIILAVIALIVVVGAAVALSKSGGMGSMNMDMSKKSASTAPTDPNTVFIDNYTFTPSPLKVKKGTTVTWTNHDIAKHNIVVDSGDGPNTKLFGKGESVTYTFDTVGDFKYHCDPHPYMHGEVIVSE